MPNQDIDIPVNVDGNSVVAIEPWEINNNNNWPEAQLQTISDGYIKLHNGTSEPIFLGKDVKKCKVRSTTNQEITSQLYYTYSPNLNKIETTNETNQISLDNIATDDVKQKINDIHDKFGIVFNKDLSKGYNKFYGEHVCRLNWATMERPAADKVRIPNYNHALRGLQQELMDNLTDQGVLLIPQDHNIQVQSVCPSFIQRKQRAKDKPESQLTKNDARLLINFGPINDISLLLTVGKY